MLQFGTPFATIGPALAILQHGYLRNGKECHVSDGLTIHQYNVNGIISLVVILDTSDTNSLSNRSSEFGGMGLMLS